MKAFKAFKLPLEIILILECFEGNLVVFRSIVQSLKIFILLLARFN